MKKNTLAVSFLALAAALGASFAHAAEEDVSQADPARWYKADDAPKERYQNLVKEANAAYGEALLACKGMRGKEAKGCKGEAGAAKKEDMERAKRIYKDYQETSPAS
ncbi:hypothetical protein [Herbaspirillum robiniae]|uniref:Uncharacterized protein n=1 Tax=Herbaspirillum robiniae TaxID=2014887 RepID=A0ABX2M0K2_9BURK|nr:hypothetical protein [Herbaspirillum robiniae]NUU02743.1 hypothetical protein [Herbaspirillum robiniae]